MPGHRNHKVLAVIGLYFVRKYLQRVQDAGNDEAAIAHVAAQMRKQGITPEVAAAILGRAPINHERNDPCESTP